ncbi:MAG: diguanylate cyclase, partial [Alphaproteobacteria bacterium]|nr:diguanylate cyclase [Alphaproteobacteria bacterium]
YRRWEIYHADIVGDPLWRDHVADHEARRPFRDFRFAFVDGRGRQRHVRLSGQPHFDVDGAFLGYRGTASDETADVEARQRIEQAELLVATVATSLPGVIFQRVQRPDGSIDYNYLGEGARTYLGFSADELTADPSPFLARIHPDDRDAFDAYRTSRGRDREWADAEYRLSQLDGSIRWLWSRSQVDHRDDGAVVWTGIVLDITARKEVEGRLSHLVHHAPLTELPNRTLLEDRLAQIIPTVRRGRGNLAVAVLGLDRFRTVNERLGLAGGDDVLRQVAARLTAPCVPAIPSPACRATVSASCCRISPATRMRPYRCLACTRPWRS